MASWNDPVIEQFRANKGVGFGPWEGKTMLLLHSVGRVTGKQNVDPLVAAPNGDDEYVLCASGGGAPKDPQWVANLEAMPGTTEAEIGDATVTVDYTVIRPGDPEWEQVYGVWRAYWPAAAEYETKTDRKFPVVKVHVRH
jgi:deazaflavin-dependent oxidoreductase (nitroreductase family)